MLRDGQNIFVYTSLCTSAWTLCACVCTCVCVCGCWCFRVRLFVRTQKQGKYRCINMHPYVCLCFSWFGNLRPMVDLNNTHNWNWILSSSSYSLSLSHRKNVPPKKSASVRCAPTCNRQKPMSWNTFLCWDVLTHAQALTVNFGIACSQVTQCLVWL